MRIDRFDDASAAGEAAAAFIAAEARAGVRDRGRFILAVSGGRTPATMLQALAAEDVPWAAVHLVQVDERVAPLGHADRNLTGLQEQLLARVHLAQAQVHVMPVDAPEVVEAASGFARELTRVAGTPARVDLVHLGLGNDGHTASLVPGDAVLGILDRDVAVTGEYQGRRRMTLTYPLLNRARKIVWLVTGQDKSEMLDRLLAGDQSIPAGRVSQANAHVFAAVTPEDVTGLHARTRRR